MGIAIVITLLLTWRHRQRVQIWLFTVGIGLIFFGGEQVLVWLDRLRATTFQG
jgi:hypothetical protein